jgi:alanyl aminopeptidase
MNDPNRLAWCALAAASLAFGAPTPPKLRLSEVQQVEPISYRAKLSLDPAKDDFEGAIQIQLDVRKPTRVVWLNAKLLTVKSASATVAGKKLPAKTSVADEYLALEFDSELPAGKAALDLAYTSKVRVGDSAGVFRVEDKGNRYILTQFENTDARHGFPCFDEPSYKVPWQLTITTPAANKVVSNTTARVTTAGGMTNYVFQETKPLPSYLIAFGVGPFEFVDAGVAGTNKIPVRIVTPKGRAAEAKYAASVTATILTRLEDYFGVPYPYGKSDQVSVPVTMGFGAMENAGMVTYGQNIILADPARDTPNRQRNYAVTAAHELAHQWFGDLVTTAWWDDIWLNEAFATWMEQKLVREWKPEWKMEMEDVGSKLHAQQQDSLMSARQIRQPIESNDDIENAFDSITYQKGASVIGMFEQWMGPDAFRRGVQSYMKRFANRTATSGAFLDELSGAGKSDIARSFSTFLNQAGIPMISVSLDCAGSSPVLHLEQSRFVPAGSKAPAAQTWRVPVCAAYGAGDRRVSECALMTEAKMDLPVAKLGSCPAWVNANDQAKGYYLPDYRGDLLAKLTTGDGLRQMSPAERVDLIGGTQLMVKAGRLSEAQALRLAETFHADPEREVLQGALSVALGPAQNLVPEDLRPNYQRFLQKNFGPKAHELGWMPKPGEREDVRLLRGGLLEAVATWGGDRALAAEARRLALQWLDKRDAVPAEVLGSVLSTAGFHGDLALFDRFLDAFTKTPDRQDQQRLISAMLAFRDPKAIQAGMQAVLSGRLKLTDGFTLIIGAGQRSPQTRKMPLEFVKAHFAEIMKDKPNIFGFDLGGMLPRVGAGFCDPLSRSELQAFFGPIASNHQGAPRTLAQTLESIDQCIATKAAQQPSVAEFLRNQ